MFRAVEAPQFKTRTLHFHINALSGTPVIDQGVEQGTVTDLGTGMFKITFTNPFKSSPIITTCADTITDFELGSNVLDVSATECTVTTFNSDGGTFIDGEVFVQVTGLDSDTVFGFFDKKQDIPTGFSARMAKFTQADSDFLSLGSASVGDITPGDVDFSFCFWIGSNTADLGSSEGVMQVYENAGNRSFSLLRTGANNITLEMSANGTASTSFQNSTSIMAGAEFYFIYYEFDKTGTVLRSFTNNTDERTISHTGGVFAGTGEDFIIGKALDTTFSDLFVGKVGFWKRLLTPSERSFLYNNGDGRDFSDFTAGLNTGITAYYELDESSDGTVPVARLDDVGSKNLTDNNTVKSAEANEIS